MSLAQYSGESPGQQMRHREIEVRYRRRKGGRCAPKSNFRVKELERVFARQYGRLLPDDDAGRDCVYIIANHLAHRDAAEPRIRFWVRRWAPWYTADEMADLLAQVLPNPIKWSADELGERIGLDDVTRTLCKAWSIGPIDCKKAKRKTRRKKRAAERKRARRLEAGARPHAQSLSQTKPWVKLGMSRRTYERKGLNVANDANSSAAYPSDIMLWTELRHGVPAGPHFASKSAAVRAAPPSGGTIGASSLRAFGWIGRRDHLPQQKELNESSITEPREPKFIVITASCCNII